MKELSEQDQKTLEHVRSAGPMGMATLENRPPRGLSASEARVSAQRLVSRGELVIDADLKLALPFAKCEK